jgi:hypothetical protein
VLHGGLRAGSPPEEWPSSASRSVPPFANRLYHVRPGNGTAPVRIGTKDFASHFKGAVDDLRVYDRALSAAEVVQLYNDAAP